MDINKVLNISTRLQFIGIKRGEIKGSFVKVTQTSNTLSTLELILATDTLTITPPYYLRMLIFFYLSIPG